MRTRGRPPGVWLYSYLALGSVIAFLLLFHWLDGVYGVGGKRAGENYRLGWTLLPILVPLWFWMGCARLLAGWGIFGRRRTLENGCKGRPDAALKWSIRVLLSVAVIGLGVALGFLMWSLTLAWPLRHGFD